MNPSKSLSLKTVIAILTIAAALPALAQKHRAVRHPSPPGPVLTVTATGTILDAVTGQPVAFADVRLGNRRDTADRQGKFSIRSTTLYGSGEITAARSGYSPASQTITTTGPQEVTLRLQPTPTVTLRLVNGTQKQIDYESVEFGYVPPFSSYHKNEMDDFCKTDGTAVTLHRTQFSRITGPAMSESFAGCCSTGTVQRINAVLRTGESLPLYFTDSCLGYSIDFIGRDHVTGDYTYTKFSDVAEIIFP
jgi:hypothetical protein